MMVANIFITTVLVWYLSVTVDTYIPIHDTHETRDLWVGGYG